MFETLCFEEIVNYILIGLSTSYLYKAVKQIITKEITFYKQEIYTDDSISKWAVIDGLLKAFTATVCGAFGILGLYGYKQVWYVISAVILNIFLYLFLYKKILVRK